jgi:hypothetical protein
LKLFELRDEVIGVFSIEKRFIVDIAIELTVDIGISCWIDITGRVNANSVLSGNKSGIE